MRKVLIFIICLSLWAAPKRLEAFIQNKIEIDVNFEICLTYAICSFRFIEGDIRPKKAGFFHDIVVVRMHSLGNLTYIDQCNSGISDYRSYVWQLAMSAIADADEIIIRGEKFRSSIQGTIVIDGVEIRQFVKDLLDELAQCKF